MMTENFVNKAAFAAACINDDESSQRERILNISDIEEKLFFVPEWKEDILLVALNAEQRCDVLQRNINMKTGQPNLKSMMVEFTILGAYNQKTRKPIFRKEDKEMLYKKSGKAIERIGKEISVMSGIDNAQLEETEKN